MLEKVGADLTEIPFQVIVCGYTDNVPVGRNLMAQYPTNWDLAAARAVEVVRVLESAGNFAPGSGCGPYHLVRPCPRCHA